METNKAIEIYLPNIVSLNKGLLAKQKEIAEAIPCVETTIWRNIGRLIDKLAIFWYGADALKE